MRKQEDEGEEQRRAYLFGVPPPPIVNVLMSLRVNLKVV